MPNFASVLKDEIARVARKELRAEVEPLKKALNICRKDMTSLKRRAVELEREVHRLRKEAAKGSKVSSPKTLETPNTRTRFSAKGLLAQRTRLGLSAEECGLLVGASGQSIYNWEAGKVRPRDRHIAAIAALKNLGKKSAISALSAARPPA